MNIAIFRKMCRQVIRDCDDEYAKSYAQYGLHCRPGEIPAQCLYILSNVSRWQGDTARKTKDELKRISQLNPETIQ